MHDDQQLGAREMGWNPRRSDAAGIFPGMMEMIRTEERRCHGIQQ